MKIKTFSNIFDRSNNKISTNQTESTCLANAHRLIAKLIIKWAVRCLFDFKSPWCRGFN